jgi:N-methylhydantoinase A
VRRIGVDTGGTFTDTVVLDGDRVAIGKALTTPGELARGVLDSLAAAADDLGTDLDTCLAGTELLAFGTTVGLNALLTGGGARIGLLTTEGFEGVVPIAKGNKVQGLAEHLRTEPTHWDKPELLLPRHRIVGVRERIDVRGDVLVPLDEDHARAAIARLGRADVEAVGICLLWSPVRPDHERRLAELVRAQLPGVHVTVSHELAPRIGEYERAMTVVLNAVVAPLVVSALADLERRLRDHGFTGRCVVTRSGGGVARLEQVARRPVDTLRSGPVGGVGACTVLGARLGHPNVVATDVGGTSFDVGLVIDGRPQMVRRPMIDRYAVATPVVDVVSIGTGGGSIAWIDAELGALRVGPASAGADPGPACYGRGGTRPTVTDAAVVLGLVDRLGGRLQLDVAAARTAVELDLATPLGLAVEDAAERVLTVANAQMADLVRRVTVQRGHDPADLVLYAYGGAAPQYAGRYAADLGVREVVVPALASVLCAYGAVAADLRTTAERDLRPAPVREGMADGLAALAELDARVRVELAGDDAAHAAAVVVQRVVGLRFARQTHELTVPVPDDAPTDADALAKWLDVAHREEYERLVGPGTAHADAAVELVRVAVDAQLPLGTPLPSLAAGSGTPVATHRRSAWFAGGWRDCPVYDGASLGSGAAVTGPAFVELPTTTLVVEPSHRATVGPTGDVVLTLGPSPERTTLGGAA